MTDDEIMAAIAYLEAGGEHGTAFLVSKDGLVLTAFHCVGRDTSTEDAPRWIAPTVTLHFPRTSSPSQAHPVAFSVKEDWALLRCTPAPAAVPFPLVEPDPALERWETFGFPQTLDSNGSQNPGETYDGTIAQAGDRLQLHFRQGGNKTMSAGVSGAPLLVGREAIGVIVQSLRDAKEVGVEPTLWARRLNAARLREHALDVQPARLPFQERLTFFLRLNADDAVTILEDLQLSPAIHAEVRVRAVVRRLLSSPIERIRGVLGTLASRGKLENGFIAGALLGAARLPVAALERAISLCARSMSAPDDVQPPGPRGLFVAYRDDLIPKLYAVAAGVTHYADQLEQRIFVLATQEWTHVDPGRGLLDALLTKVRDRLGAAADAPLADVKAALADELGELAILVVVLQPVDVKDLAAIAAAFPLARFLVRADRAPDALADAGFGVASALPPDEESMIRRAFGSWPKPFRKVLVHD